MRLCIFTLLVQLQLCLDVLGGEGDADLDAPRDAPGDDAFERHGARGRR